MCIIHIYNVRVRVRVYAHLRIILSFAYQLTNAVLTNLLNIRFTIIHFLNNNLFNSLSYTQTIPIQKQACNLVGGFEIIS